MFTEIPPVFSVYPRKIQLLLLSQRGKQMRHWQRERGIFGRHSDRAPSPSPESSALHGRRMSLPRTQAGSAIKSREKGISSERQNGRRRHLVHGGADIETDLNSQGFVIGLTAQYTGKCSTVDARRLEAVVLAVIEGNRLAYSKPPIKDSTSRYFLIDIRSFQTIGSVVLHIIYHAAHRVCLDPGVRARLEHRKHPPLLRFCLQPGCQIILV